MELAVNAFPSDEKVLPHITNEALIEILKNKIYENLGIYFNDVRESKQVTLNGEPWSGQDLTRTFRFKAILDNGACNHVFFVKVCPTFRSLNPALQEYETLKLLYDRLPLIRERCKVARPLDYFSDLNAYLQESVGTKNFKKFLLRNNSRLRSNNSLFDLLNIVSGCADWLSGFHEITKTQKTVPFDRVLFLDSISDDFDYHMLGRFNFSRTVLSKLTYLFEQDLQIADGVLHMPCAKFHYDYTPAHVYIDDNQISVIDILGVDDVPIYEDIGHFLAAMSAVNSFPFYPLFDISRATGVLSDKFLERYCSAFEYKREEFFFLSNVFRLKYLIFWFGAQYSRVSSKTSPTIGKLYANLRLSGKFERLIDHAIKSIYKCMSGKIRTENTL